MFENRKLLLVEDDQAEISNISRILSRANINFTLSTTLADAQDKISKNQYDFLLTDLHIETKAGFERPDGLLVIKAAKENLPNITIVATSSDPRSQIWNEALNAGAHNFIRKPLSKKDEIIISFGMARDRRVMLQEAGKSKSKTSLNGGRWKSYASGFPFGIVISEKDVKRVRGISRRPDSNFVITGETGTGKEEVAKLVHRLRSEAEGPIPFVAVNCATISGSLAESLLFGHKKGAFTGADQSTSGFISDADGGILFLDEIHTLDLRTQQKLLRVLNDGSYYKLGETKVYRSQFQLIAASTKDLDEEVEEGRFLVDIRTRMMGYDMKILPLRERLEDIAPLAALFLSKKEIELDYATFQQLVSKLKTFHWSGNIRQLMKALENWILTCEFDDIPLLVENFPIIKGMKQKEEKLSPMGTSERFHEFESALRQDVSLDEAMAAYEKSIIVAALARHPTIGECCRALGISRSAMDLKRKKYDIF